MPHCAVVTLDVGVMLGLAGLHVLNGVDLYGAGLAAPFDDLGYIPNIRSSAGAQV
jgi:hypothetical protein